jgi:hypothetical protein
VGLLQADGTVKTLAVLMLLSAAPVFAQYQAEGEGVKVTVYKEPCALKEVTNLPQRATWTENGKIVEGCAGIMRGIVLCYWLDRTVTAIPTSVFVRVTET